MAQTVAVIERPALAATQQSYVEWAPIFAGGLAALAVSTVLLTFGVAIGLASVSPYTTTGTGLKAVGFGSAFWFLLVTIWSLALGGYLVGRLRHRWADATADEVKFRDGAHGLLVWALVIVASGMLAASGVSAVGRGVSAFAVPAGLEPTSVAADVMLRPSKAEIKPVSAETRAEVARVLVRSGRDGEISAADKAYIANVVSANTGVSQEDAVKRVDQALADMKASIDRARKLGIVFGFYLAATLLIGAATAWWSSVAGGKHREAGTFWHGLG
jgi:hypothetical protein